MENEYIFFYSNYDEGSNTLKNTLSKYLNLSKMFYPINVNNKALKIPKIITHIPAFIITENGVTNVLFEPDASNWIKKKVETENNSSINDWDPSAMCGFSDNFSSIENPNGMNKDFAFIENEDMQIYTPDSDPIGGQKGQQQNGHQQPQQQQQMQQMQPNFFNNNNNNTSTKNMQKSKTDVALEKLMNERNLNIPRPISRQ